MCSDCDGAGRVSCGDEGPDDWRDGETLTARGATTTMDSEARLAEIRARVDGWPRGYWLAGEKNASLIQNDSAGSGRHQIAAISCEHAATVDLLAHAYADMQDLLAEVERLRAREAALVEIVRAVAEARGTDSLHDDTIFLRRDGAERVIEQARALLASGSAGSEGSERNDND